MSYVRHFRHVVPLTVVVLVCCAHIAAVRASTFHLAAPRHQQSPHSTHHHQHHHHHHNNGGKHRSTGLSHMFGGRNQTVTNVIGGSGDGDNGSAGSVFAATSASASAHASISTPANDTRKPLKLTLITASSSSVSSHSIDNGVALETQSINHRRWRTGGEPPQRIDRINERWPPQPAAAPATPTFRALQHTGSRPSTG